MFLSTAIWGLLAPLLAFAMHLYSLQAPAGEVEVVVVGSAI